MNSTDNAANAESHNANPEAGSPIAAATGWRHWIRRLLVCNPFFLCSAALLLFGVNRLSSDEKLFVDEIHNVVFNFSALQFYEVLVVLTALLLARRRIWYDSALLAVLENGLVLVPFMLISQATLQGEAAGDGLRLAWTLSLAGGVVAVFRSAAIRKWYPHFNLPLRAQILGLAILAGNVALPLVFRPRMERDVADWQEENLMLWYVVLPLVAAAGNLLSRPIRYGGLNPERHWLPIFIHGLWLSGSAVHVWCVAHICNLPLESRHLAPLTCAIAWTAWNRISDFVPNPSLRWRRSMLMLTFLSPLPAFGEGRIFVALVALNVTAYAVLWLRSFDNWQLRTTVKHLAIASVAMLLAGLPADWSAAFVVEFTRVRGIVLGIAFYGLLHALRSRRPDLGLAGALGIGILAVLTVPRVGYGLHPILQGAFVFLLLHSLRWLDDEHVFARSLRWLVAMAWSLDSFFWTRTLGSEEIAMAGGAALLVSGGWLAAWWWQARRGSMALPVASVLTLTSGPGNWLMRQGSEGVLALVGSLALFTLGVLVAWTRHRWESKGSLSGGP